uniref:Uncharacterized protein n=1 Tax=Oryza punctata TaxID=4537 RepID=A0A0E0LG81_ORYPU
MSFAARRMMAAAARRAFHSQRPSSSRISITEEEPREKANLSQVLCQLDAMTRRQVAHEIKIRSKIVRIDANPTRGPADGVIWYGRTWANNLAAVFVVCAWYGVYQVRANENQKSDLMSSKSPPS